MLSMPSQNCSRCVRIDLLSLFNLRAIEKTQPENLTGA